jgi:hypothetical protein
MDLHETNLDYDTIKNQGTGNRSFEDTRTILYPFSRYEIRVRVSSTGGFIGIDEIKVRKDFLSHIQKMQSLQAHDVEEFYKEEEDAE